MKKLVVAFCCMFLAVGLVGCATTGKVGTGGGEVLSPYDYRIAGLFLAKASPTYAGRIGSACTVIKAFDDPQKVIDYLNGKLNENSNFLNMNEEEAKIVKGWILERASGFGINIDAKNLVVLSAASEVDMLGLKTNIVYICEGIQAGLQ